MVFRPNLEPIGDLVSPFGRCDRAWELSRRLELLLSDQNSTRPHETDVSSEWLVYMGKTFSLDDGRPKDVPLFSSNVYTCIRDQPSFLTFRPFVVCPRQQQNNMVRSRPSASPRHHPKQWSDLLAKVNISCFVRIDYSQ